MRELNPLRETSGSGSSPAQQLSRGCCQLGAARSACPREPACSPLHKPHGAAAAAFQAAAPACMHRRTHRTACDTCGRLDTQAQAAQSSKVVPPPAGRSPSAVLRLHYEALEGSPHAETRGRANVTFGQDAASCLHKLCFVGCRHQSSRASLSQPSLPCTTRLRPPRRSGAAAALLWRPLQQPGAARASWLPQLASAPLRPAAAQQVRGLMMRPCAPAVARRAPAASRARSDGSGWRPRVAEGVGEAPVHAGCRDSEDAAVHAAVAATALDAFCGGLLRFLGAEPAAISELNPAVRKNRCCPALRAVLVTRRR